MRRLATTLRTTRSFASAPATPRIAICGAGVSGLTLAGILSNGTRDVQLTVFERARRDRDQGYGLDLDEHGQEALVRAGVYDRYWDISYPYSDTSVGYQFSGGEPLLNIFWPRLTMVGRLVYCGSIAFDLPRSCLCQLAVMASTRKPLTLVGAVPHR